MFPYLDLNIKAAFCKVKWNELQHSYLVQCLDSSLSSNTLGKSILIRCAHITFKISPTTASKLISYYFQQ